MIGAAAACRRDALLRPATLLAGVAAAAALRCAAGVETEPAAALFAGALLALAFRAGWRPSRPRPAALIAGAGGAALLVAVPLLHRLAGAAPVTGLSPAAFPAWGAAAVAVAVTEEIVLRGLLVDAMRAAGGDLAAVAVAALAFAVLHVPMYGWQAVPLDLGVGLWLGALRLATGGVAAPATAHALADLAGWWLW